MLSERESEALDISIAEMLRRGALRQPDRLAVADLRCRYTFEELWAAVRRSARAAMAHGMEPGDRVVVWSPNSADWAVAALGAVSAGGVLVPLSTRFKAIEARDIISRTQPKLLFLTPQFLDIDFRRMLADATGGLDCPERVVMFAEEADDTEIAWSDYLVTGDRVSDDTLEERLDGLRADTISDAFFTSGTTGRPKGALSAHGQVVRAGGVFMDSVGTTAGSRTLCVQPLFHIFGYKACLIGSLSLGGGVVLLPAFDVEHVLQRIQDERIDVFPAPPTVFSELLEHPDRDRWDLSSLHRAFTGSTNVPPILLRRMLDELRFTTVTTAYGMTEATVITVMHVDDDPQEIATWCGRAVPGVEVRVVGDDGNDVPRGEPGEILARGWVVMKGYLDDPEATSATIDDEGWLKTGDIGVMDERGFVRITDRKKDLIIVGGFNVYPAEVENLLLASERISQCAVVGAADDRLGEVPVAFVVPRGGEEVDAEALVAWARERISNYKVPRQVRVVEDLPKNASGKIVKFELRKMLKHAGS